MIDERIVTAVCPPPITAKWKAFIVKSFADENPNIK